MSEIVVRAARTADEPSILELARDEMRAHEALDERFRLRKDAVDRYAVYVRARMRDIDSNVFVAELGGRIVGMGIGSIRKQESFFLVQRYGYLSDLVVTPDSRRRGVGRAIFDRISLWCRGLGIDVLRLHIASKSDAAQAFWKSVGASEYLVEAWIDMESQRPEPPAPAESESEASGESDVPESEPIEEEPSTVDRGY
jgi:GNAT superfamily N-acetyltransferase